MKCLIKKIKEFNLLAWLLKLKTMITKITTHDYTSSQVLTVDADKETIAKILAFVAELNKEQQITSKELVDLPY